jgi:hypothetical protein
VKQWILGKTYGTIGSQTAFPVYTPLRGNEWANNDADTQFKHSHPWSVAGSFKNLYVEIMWPEENPAGGGWPDIDFEVYINDAPTGLIVTVPAAGPSLPPPGYMASGQNTTDIATIAPGDTVALTRGPGDIPPGFNEYNAMIAWTLTFESDNDGESGYGIATYGAGYLAATNLVLSAPFAGAGGFANEAIGAPVVTSIVPLDGSLFRLDVLLYVAPGTGATRTFAALLNGVIQDGTGGTIDTTVAISDSALSGFSVFDLPIAVLDKLSIVQLVSGGTAPALSLVNYSVGVLATTDGQSALGFISGNSGPIQDGSTDFVSGATSGFAWTTAAAPTPFSTSKPDRWPMSEGSMSLPGPIDSYGLANLCVYLSQTPGSGNSWLFTTRRGLADTPGSLLMADSTDLDVGPSEAGTYAAPTDRMDLSAVGDSTPTAAALSWTWLVTETTTPPIVSTSYPIRRLRRFALPFTLDKWIFISRVELIMQAGNGLSGTVVTQGYNPIVMFRLSRDGGATWDDELQMATGKIGEYTARAYLNRLGRARNPVVELTSSDPVFVSWIDFTVDYEEGTS